MKNSNAQTITTEAKDYTMSKERFMEMVANFKAFVKDKANHPTYDKTYGTKYAGKVTFEHFVLYAILRNKDTAKTSHDPMNSEEYLDLLAQFRKWATQDGKINAWNIKRLTAPFGINEDELKSALVVYFK